MNSSTNDKVTYGQSDNEQTQATNNKIKTEDDAKRDLLKMFADGFAETSKTTMHEAEAHQAQLQQQAEMLERNILSGAETNPFRILSYGFGKIQESRSAKERGEAHNENPTSINPASNTSEVESLRASVEALTAQMQAMAKGNA